MRPIRTSSFDVRFCFFWLAFCSLLFPHRFKSGDTSIEWYEKNFWEQSINLINVNLKVFGAYPQAGSESSQETIQWLWDFIRKCSSATICVRAWSGSAWMKAVARLLLICECSDMDSTTTTKKHQQRINVRGKHMLCSFMDMLLLSLPALLLTVHLTELNIKLKWNWPIFYLFLISIYLKPSCF